MIRNFKFRVWDGKKMVTLHEAIFERGLIETEGGNELVNEYPNDVILMQFTGLLDKNGKEIYEGDVVEYIDLYTDYKGVGEIIYEGAEFVIYNKKYKSNHFSYCDLEHAVANKCVTIVGNMCENVELIKQ